MKIHHIGYAVRDIEKSLQKFKELGYVDESEVVNDDERKVYIKFIKNGDYRIELISPMEKGSPVDELVKKGGGPYHICYEVENINDSIGDLKNQGYIMLETPSRAIAIKNKKVTFMFKKEIGLIELIENKD